MSGHMALCYAVHPRGFGLTFIFFSGCHTYHSTFQAVDFIAKCVACWDRSVVPMLSDYVVKLSVARVNRADVQYGYSYRAIIGDDLQPSAVSAAFVKGINVHQPAHTDMDQYRSKLCRPYGMMLIDAPF